MAGLFPRYGILPLPEKMADLAAFLTPRADVWKEEEVPLETRGVSLRWFQDFVREIQLARDNSVELYEHEESVINWVPTVPEGMKNRYVPLTGELTPRSLVRDHVIGLTRDCRGPLYALVPPEAKGKPSVFVSHTWSSDFFYMGYGTAEALNRVGETKIWIDVACYNQHRVEDIAAHMKAVIAGVDKVVFPMSAEPFYKRTWCLWELVCAHLNDKEVVLLTYLRTPREYQSMRELFMEHFTSIADSETSIRGDHESIMQAFLDEFGSVAAADRYVREMMAASINSQPS